MKLISEIKVKTRKLKDERNNKRQLLDCIKGLKSPDNFWLCKNMYYYKGLSASQKTQYFMSLSKRCKLLEEQIDNIGKTILFLRGSKWDF